MPQAELNPVELVERLTRLEHRCANLRIVAWLALIGVVAMKVTPPLRSETASAPAPSGALQADSLVLHDKSNNPRAVWSIGPAGDVILALKDQAGQNRLSLSVAEDGTPRMRLLDRGGLTVVDLAAELDFRSHLRFFDGPSQARLSLDLGESRAPSLRLFDAAHLERLSLALDKTDLPALAMYDSKQLRAQLGMMPGNTIALAMLDAAGALRANLASAETGPTHLRFFDQERKARITLGYSEVRSTAQTEEFTLSFVDRLGRENWTEPRGVLSSGAQPPPAP